MTANLGIAVIWELNQAVLSLIPDSRTLDLTLKFVPTPVIQLCLSHARCQEPDKNFIGCIENVLLQASCLSPFGPAKAVQNGSRQFCDFLGYRFGLPDSGLAEKTITYAVNKVRQLYEQKKYQPNWKMLLDDYRQHWVTWIYSGIPSSIIYFDKETILNCFFNRRKPNPINPNAKMATTGGALTFEVRIIATPTPE
jgi:hypothetical protein